jgi:DNA-binding CsgD family transcriptional regulator
LGERETLDHLLADALSGSSQVLVLRGDAGVGKSALLAYLSANSVGWRVESAAGVESEMELAYSGLHQLCVPMLDRLERLPAPQRDALSTVFGLSAGPRPDTFLVGLATLTLLAEVSEEQPLLCIVEDAQWLDEASAQIVGFVARRLRAERIAILSTARSGSGDHVFAGLPELAIDGLEKSEARALLLEHVTGPLDTEVCDQIVAESHGNPLALIELPRTWNRTSFGGGFGMADALPVTGKIEQSYKQRLLHLPERTQLLVLIAAAEPLGDPALLQRAVEALALGMADADPAVEQGLLEIDHRVRFAHPVARSVAYRVASSADRRRAHDALARATDAEIEPDRRAWHRAQATSGPDEAIAAELEGSAARAQSRGGVSAAAAFLRQAVALTGDPSRKAARALAAAQVCLQAGALDVTLELVSVAETSVADDRGRATVDLLRGQVAFASGSAAAAASLLLSAASRIEAYDLALSRETYLTAYGAAAVAGRFADRTIQEEICRAIRSLPAAAESPLPIELLLDGLAQLELDGWIAAAPALRRAADALRESPLDPRWLAGWLATAPAGAIWDNEGQGVVAAEQVRIAREAGALAGLPLHLAALGLVVAWTGDFARAEALVEEARDVAEATGTGFAPFTSLRLLALKGNEADAAPAIADAFSLAERFGQGIAESVCHWSAAVLYNGLARYEEAVVAARSASLGEDSNAWTSLWALPELVESASRSGDEELAQRGLELLVQTTQSVGNDAARGFEARCRALLSSGETAELLYRQAIEHLGRSGLRPELARAHLLYGESLRREGRRVDARIQLRAAHDQLTAIGMAAFAERARIELLATGEKVRKRGNETRSDLTPQELQIALLAREMLSNPEIGTRLFLSPRTVEWHLGKVFTKLGIDSRRKLREALPESGTIVART